MQVNSRRPLFNRRSHSNIYRVFLWSILILAGVWVIRSTNQGEIKPVGQPTPTPTRTTTSLVTEGDAHFTTGKLDAAITAYQQALAIDPNNAEVWAKMARIQVYSSELLTSDEAKRIRLREALDSINQAKALSPEDSTVAAIRAFVLDWNSNPYLNPDLTSDYLVEAEQEAQRALQLDGTNTLGLVYYAEILIDQQNLPQGDELLSQAIERGEEIMDLHRVYAYLLESYGLYNQAIQEYDKAIAINPNLTFLYLRAGANYRQLAFGNKIEEQQKALYEQSLDYFAKAARINEQLGVQDPIPYLSIAKTYSQLGEYFIAGRNVLKALSFKPDDADVYGQLGIVFFKSRNYEGSIPALKCAIRGCTAEESCEARGGCDDTEIGMEVQGLPLSQSTVVYYYTYGSVLAALSRPRQNYCAEAMQVFSEVRAFTTEASIIGIIREGESICYRVGIPGIATAIPTSLPGETQSAPMPAPATETPGPALEVTPSPSG